MLKRTLVLVLSASLIASGCASAGGPRVQPSPTFGPNDRALLADYVQKLPLGSRIRVERTAGSTLRGTLLKTTPDAIVCSSTRACRNRPSTCRSTRSHA